MELCDSLVKLFDSDLLPLPLQLPLLLLPTRTFAFPNQRLPGQFSQPSFSNQI